jgi:CheY-like chemotaxis protein
MEIARRQCNQLTHLVDDLLDINRISQNKIFLKKEQVELNEIIKLALLDNEQQFRGKSIRLNVESASALYIEADALRLTQVIGNLLHNAAKYTGQGDLITVTISHDENTNEAVITVQDTGSGIEPECMDNLFEPFTQCDASLDRSFGGLGLGLAIVKRIVELHDGRVEAYSEGRGKGARFTITLPLLKEKIREQVQIDGIEPASKGSLNILLIDDNKDLTEVLCGFIDFLGHKPAAAHHGTEGIAKARAIRPDVIICDIGLPGMSGYEVARTIREDTELRHTFLIALSGYAQSEDIECSMQAGFDCHLGKPVSIGTLQQAFNAVNGSKPIS